MFRDYNKYGMNLQVRIIPSISRVANITVDEPLTLPLPMLWHAMNILRTCKKSHDTMFCPQQMWLQFENHWVLFVARLSERRIESQSTVYVY